MRIGIDLIDLAPKMSQGINVYSENLVKGFIKLNKKVKLQLYVNKNYYNYAVKEFKSKNTKIIIYNQSNLRLKYILNKLFFQFFSLLNIKSLFLYAFIKNYFFKDFKILIEKNSDVLICPNVILNHYDFNIKTLLCIHDIQHTYLPENFSRVERNERYHTRNNSVKKCDILIASSNFLKKQCNSFFNKKLSSIKVISEGVDFKVFKKKNYSNKKIGNIKLPKKFIFYPAGFWPHKNHLLLLKAINNLNQKRKRINLVLCGSKKSFYKKIIKYIDDNKLFNVSYLGSIDHNNLIKCYNLCTGVVMPSIEESASLLLKETAAIGKPFLGSNTKTFIERNQEFKITLFNVNKVSDLEKKISDLYFNSSKYKKKIKYNNLVIKKYSWENIANQFYQQAK